jgi:acyl-CoA synthetase (NDP forming)
MIVMMVGAPLAEAASEQQRHVKWDELSEIVGKKVRVVMPDGARIQGTATALEEDALVVEIGKTSNKASCPKGKFLVPRATLKAVDIEHPSVHWRILCVAIGGGLGVLAADLAHASSQNGFIRSNALEAVFASAAVAAPVGGYFIGRAADRRTITYVITP